MNKIRYILDMTNIQPDGRVRARLSAAFISASTRKKVRRRRMIALAAAAAVIAATACVIAAVGIYRSVRAGRKDPTPAPVTDSGTGDSGTLVIGCELTPMYDGDPYYEEFRETVKYSRLLSDGVAAVNANGVKKLAKRFKADPSQDLDKIIMTLYAGSEYGDYLILENVRDADGESEPLKFYSEGFDPVIIAASRSGSFEYLIVADLRRASDGYVYTRGARVGQYINGSYVMDIDAIKNESADMYKIRFEFGRIVIYERTEVSLSTVFLETASGFSFGHAGNHFLSGDPNDMMSVMYPEGDHVPDEFLYTFSFYNTDAASLSSSDAAGVQMSRRDMCDIINGLMLQWFVPLHRFDSGNGVTYIGIGIGANELSLQSMVSDTLYPIYGPGNFYIECLGESYGVDLYYSPYQSDRPYFNERFSESVKKLLIVELTDNMMQVDALTIEEACDLIRANGGETLPTDVTATSLPVICEDHTFGIQPFSVDELCFCVNAGTVAETPDLFGELGLSVAVPGLNENYAVLYVKYLDFSVCNTGGGALIRHNDTDYDIKSVVGYVTVGDLTVSYDGYLNGIIGRDAVHHGNLCPFFEFSVMTDREGHALQIFRGLPKEAGLSGYYTSDLLDCGLYAGEVCRLLRVETLDAAAAFASVIAPETTSVDVLLSSDTGDGLFTYFGYKYYDDYGDTLLISDACTAVYSSDNSRKKYIQVSVSKNYEGFYYEE